MRNQLANAGYSFYRAVPMGIGYEDDRRRDKPVEGLPFGSRRVQTRVEKIRGFPLLTRILSAFYKIDDRKEVVKYGIPGRPVIRGRFAPTFRANYFAGDLCPEDIFQDNYYSGYGRFSVTNLYLYRLIFYNF